MAGLCTRQVPRGLSAWTKSLDPRPSICGVWRAWRPNGRHSHRDRDAGRWWARPRSPRITEPRRHDLVCFVIATTLTLQRGRAGGLADRMAQARQSARLEPPSPLAGVDRCQRGSSDCSRQAAQDGRRAGRGRWDAASVDLGAGHVGRTDLANALARLDQDDRALLALRSTSRVPSLDGAGQGDRAVPIWDAAPARPLGLLTVFERSSTMTDPLDFEARLEGRLRARAALVAAVRCCCDRAEAVAAGGRRRTISRREWPSTQTGSRLVH